MIIYTVYRPMISAEMNRSIANIHLKIMNAHNCKSERILI